MKKLSLLFVALFAGAAAIAQPSDKFTGALLWKISGGGLDAPSHILGTHHFSGADTFDAIPGARAALEASRQVVGELVTGDMAALAGRLQLAAMLPEGESYKTLLSETDYAALDEGLKSLMGVGMDQFAAFKPGMIGVLVSRVLFAKTYPEVNFATLVPMDVMVQNFATERGLPVVGLETMDDQIHALFDALPLKFQAESLVCNVRHVDEGIAALKQLSADYAAGDLVAMYRSFFHDPESPCPTSEEEKNVMLKERNDKWLEKLPAIMAEGSAFVAVGAMHLAGEEGLLFRLDRMGYTVEAVK